MTEGNVDMKVEVVVIAVTDVDRSKQFYERLGWRLDADAVQGEDFRIVQLTPPGSPCSVQFGTGVTSVAPGSARDTYLVVPDIVAATDELRSLGVEIGEVFHETALGGRFQGVDGADRRSGPSPDHQTYGSFARFADPDGNTWLLQEITARLPGRVDPVATSFTSAGELALALRRAADAHGKHEERTGEADADWPSWYAEYLVREQAGDDLPL
jgi:catechol 2,3-dioxygenase-like lactoylglutathione lyase family enzyme